MDTQKPFPISAEQLYQLTLPEQRAFPIVWRKKQHIDDNDTSTSSKKYSLPFWPINLQNEIEKILSPENNGDTKLSFIFQLNLEDFYFPDLPRSGIIQFYCANNNLLSCDYNEEDKDKFEAIMCQKNTGAYQIIYIDTPHLNEKAVSPNEIRKVITPYIEGEKPHTLFFRQQLFEIPLLHNTMYHRLQELGYKTSNIRQTFDEYIKENSRDTINKTLDALFKFKETLFISVLDTLFHKKLKTSYGNKCGGFPIYIELDNRKKENSKFDYLLFQVDTIILQEFSEEDIDEHEHSHKLDIAYQPYVLGVNVNRKQLAKWKKNPTLCFKDNVDTLLHKQYFQDTYK